MTITPYFTIHQTVSHVELDIRVPHVRVTPESIQVVILENSILHFASPPYLLILNFTALNDDTDTTNGEDTSCYRFDETASEACAKYEPTIENGMIHLSLKKASNVAKLWTNLHLLGRMILPRISKSNNGNSNHEIKNSNSKSSPTSQWLLEEVDSTCTTTTTTSSSIEEDVQTLPDDTNKRLRRQKGYGFGGMFDGIFSDLTRDGLAKEMLECSPDDENEDTLLAVDVHDDDESVNKDIDDSLSYSQRRRIQRRQMENSKFDQDRYRQDLNVEDDYIYQCAMAMKPHWITMQQQQDCASSSCCSVYGGGGNIDSIESITKRLDSLVVAESNSPQPSSKGQQQQQQQESQYFTEEERLKLVSIPYPLLSSETRLTSSTSRCHRSQEQQQNDDNDNNDNDLTMGILVGLIDLLFAYVYDHLTTDGDATVESAWTVSILSASLSWMEDWQHLTFTTTKRPTSDSSISNPDDDSLERTLSRATTAAAIQEVLYSSLRRALIYPYLRNLGFALHCATQVADILHNGPCCILRCLLQMRNVLNHSELYYLGNKLFIDPYLAWIQQQNSNILSRGLVDMSQAIHQLVSAFDKNITTCMEECKQKLGLDLMWIENQQDNENSSSSSSSLPDSDTGDDDDDEDDCSSSSSEETQSHDDDDKSTGLSSLPETSHKEQQRFEEKGTAAVSSELLDCSLGFSALHIVKPCENNVETESFMFSPTIITDESHLTEPSTTCKLTEEDPCEESSSPSTPKKLIGELDD